MNRYRELVAADIRISILQLLEEDPGYSHNERVIKGGLAGVGHEVSSDRVRTELHWLEEQGCVSIDESADLLVAKLTARGEDVALGHVHVPGVARPAL